MGLDVSHNCWHGAYSAFMRWRKKLAEVAGLPPLEMMDGFWTPPRGDRPMGFSLSVRVAADSLARAYGPKEAERLLDVFNIPAISWDALKPDPLLVLLRHSDCDGSIEAKDCAGIADSLERLLPLLPDQDDGGHIGNWREKTAKFISGLRAAADAGEDVQFG